MVNWPLVVPNDDGIRPAGPPDACFYCKNRVGEPHGLSCVVVQKRVRVTYTFTLEIDIPHNWEAKQFEFHRNAGSWCADNAIDELSAILEDDNGPGCLCQTFKAKLVEVIDERPRRSVRG
jgi:hypothetical protein